MYIKCVWMFAGTVYFLNVSLNLFTGNENSVLCESMRTLSPYKPPKQPAFPGELYFLNPEIMLSKVHSVNLVCNFVLYCINILSSLFHNKQEGLQCKCYFKSYLLVQVSPLSFSFSTQLTCVHKINRWKGRSNRAIREINSSKNRSVNSSKNHCFIS